MSMGIIKGTLQSVTSRESQGGTYITENEVFRLIHAAHWEGVTDEEKDFIVNAAEWTFAHDVDVIANPGTGAPGFTMEAQAAINDWVSPPAEPT
jgi:hypothetical protein